MSVESSQIRTLIDKIQHLSKARRMEVEDFIDFIRARERGENLTQIASRAAEPSLSKVWDNPEDAAYDKL